MKKALALMMAFAMVFSLTACGGGNDSTTTAPAGTAAETGAETSSKEAGGETEAAPSGDIVSSKDTLVVALDADPGTMNPYVGFVGPQLSLSCQSLEALTTYDEDGNLVPGLAESWEFDENGMGCTFHLRKDVTFSNGDPFTAEAVIYTMTVAAQESASAKGYLVTADLENLKAIDDHTLYVPTVVESGILPDALSNIFIVNPKTYAEEAAAGEGLTGTGPFVVSGWEAGVSVSFTANENYWNGAPYIKNMVFRIITESSVRMVELENGTVDVYKGGASNDISRVVNGEVSNVSLWKANYPLSLFYFGINLSSPKTSDIKVREAIMKAVDNETLALVAFENIGETARNILPNDMWYTKELTGDAAYSYDPEAAKALLAEAGYADGITLKLVCDSNSFRRAMAEVLPSMMAKAGITLEVEYMEGAAFNSWRLEAGPEAFDVFLANIGQMNEPGSAMTAFRESSNKPEGGGNGMFRYAGSEVGTQIEDLFVQSAKETDLDARAEIYYQLEDVIASNYIAKGISDRYDVNLVNPNLKGMKYTPNMEFSKAYFE